jgi:hypothetical protein
MNDPTLPCACSNWESIGFLVFYQIPRSESISFLSQNIQSV